MVDLDRVVVKVWIWGIVVECKKSGPALWR